MFQKGTDEANISHGRNIWPTMFFDCLVYVQAALTTLPVFGFGAFGQGHDLMVGKHPGLVCQLLAGTAQRLATGIAVKHQPCVLCRKEEMEEERCSRLL